MTQMVGAVEIDLIHLTPCSESYLELRTVFTYLFDCTLKDTFIDS